MKFLSFLRGRNAQPTNDAEAIEQLAQGLPGVDPDRARFIAGLALLLSRIAAADHEVTADEAATLERLIRDKAGLPPDQAALVVERARAHHYRHGSTDDFLVTRELAQRPYDQKVAILECLFALAAADLRIRAPESDELGRIARELRIEQPDVQRLRSQYGEFLTTSFNVDG